MENRDNEIFTYSYSAKQQEEIKNIRKKYLPPEEDKMELLRRLDASVTTPGTIASLAAGIIGTLILGVGMCCCMVWGGFWFIPGIVIGLIGIMILAFAYPLYTKLTEKQRKKLAPEILRLTEELMK
ncbi:MAG: hypothetical protein E7554_05035 [Ruminococcaceae bacterium]|nr:hypothetical protein [Oscillospiraceae bacterium]